MCVILTQTALKMGSGGLLWAANKSLGFLMVKNRKAGLLLLRPPFYILFNLI